MSSRIHTLGAIATASLLFITGCGGNEAADQTTDESQTATDTAPPQLLPPEQSKQVAAENVDGAPLPTEGDPIGDPQPPSTATAPAGTVRAEEAEIEANLASLSPEDRAVAAKQRICPVAGGLLGSMGTPTKVNVAGHEVFICCEGCEEELKENPEKHLAKIGLKPADSSTTQ